MCSHQPTVSDHCPNDQGNFRHSVVLHFNFFLGRAPLTLRWTHFGHRGLGQVPDAVSITKTAPSRFTREQVQQTSGGGRIRLPAPAKVRCLQILNPLRGAAPKKLGQGHTISTMSPSQIFQKHVLYLYI